MWSHVLNDDGRKASVEDCTYEQFYNGVWSRQTGCVTVAYSGNTYDRATGEILEDNYLPDQEIDPIPVFNAPFRNLVVPALERDYPSSGEVQLVY